MRKRNYSVRYVSSIKMCFTCSEINLSCTNAAVHTIQLQPGVTSINTRPYRLPESEKEKIDRQVKQLVEDGIITNSHSPWKSPFNSTEKGGPRRNTKMANGSGLPQVE